MSKHKKSSEKTDKKEHLVKLSPGFYANGYVFEQVEDGKYATGGNEDLVEEYSILGSIKHTSVYQPLNRTVWPLAEKGVNYGSTGELWKEVKAFIREHLFLPDENLYDVLTAWVFASWIREVWVTVPYLYFYGPIASGKTRGLEVLQQLSYRGILASNISSAALFRICEQWHPTLFLDETEIYGTEKKGEVIGLLNSGYRKGQLAVRAAPTANKDFVIKTFDVFGFKALAGTRGLAQALESRCIMIRMLKTHNQVRQLIDVEKALELRNKLLEFRFFVLQCENDLSAVSAVFLESVPKLDFADGRLVELYSPLLAVSNEGCESILEHAQNMFEIRQMEQQATIEAELVEILARDDLVDEKGVAMTKDIAAVFNETRLEREQWKTRSIGWKIRGLGFLNVNTGHGKGWVIEPNRLESLKRNYGLNDNLPRETAKRTETAKTAVDINKVFEESKPYTCWLCKGSLPTDLTNTTIHEGKTCHISCFRKLKEGSTSHHDDSKNVREVKS